MRTKLIVGSLFAFTALSSSAALLDSVNIPQTPQQEAKIELGKMLWFDPRLSLSGKISCNSCHDLSTNGADTKPLSIGYAGRTLRLSLTQANRLRSFGTEELRI